MGTFSLPTASQAPEDTSVGREATGKARLTSGEGGAKTPLHDTRSCDGPEGRAPQTQTRG